MTNVTVAALLLDVNVCWLHTAIHRPWYKFMCKMSTISVDIMSIQWWLHLIWHNFVKDADN